MSVNENVGEKIMGERILRESGGDCLVGFKIPIELYDALAVRARVFGRGVETEIKVRLLRSMGKHDFQDKTDEVIEAIYYSEEG